MAETAISTVLSRIGNLAIDSIVQETSFLHGVADQVELLKANLRQLQSFLKDADTKWRSGDDRVRNWVRELRAIAYEAENVVDKANYITRRNKMKRGFKGALSRYAHKPSDLKTLHNVGAEIQKIKTKLTNISTFTLYGIPSLEEIRLSDICFEDERLRAQRLVSPDSDENVDVIGFDHDRDRIVEKLVDPNNKLLTVISIVGMGGLGKSTLARKVCNSPKVKQHFDVVAWVAVSQKYDISHLLKEIMEKFSEQIEEERHPRSKESKEIEEMNEEAIRKKLQKILKEKRYLLVLDDVWSISTWREFQGSPRVFLEANKGSRIVFTTRNLKVAENVDQKTDIYEMEILDNEKSWELLRSKAFPSYREVSESIKTELEGLGKKLAKKCNGLPLSLVVLGGYLSKNLKYHKWLELVGKMDWEIVNNEGNVKDILALSYHDLPYNYLKSCFLYIASFPEDYEIDVTTLIQLWIAEGLVLHRPRHEIEETAHGVVDELAMRCMIQVAKRSMVDGQIDSIRIHDVLRDWGIDEGRKDGFIKVCSNQGDIETTDSNAMPAYRVSLDNMIDNQLGEAIPDLRTLLAFKLKPNLVPQLGGLGFLRVLHLEGLEEIKFPEEIKQMIYLRYIGFTGCREVLFPSSIGHLLNLQTLRATGTTIRWLPSSFWDIPTLKHVYLDKVTCLTPPKPDRRRSLQTLHISRKVSTEATIKSLGGKTPIVSLKLLYNNINDKVFSEFPGLVYLCLSGRLTKGGLPDVTIKSLGSLFLENLRQFYLECSYLEEDPMPILATLPSLVMLTLSYDAYIGSIMCCSSHGFPLLEYLRLFYHSSVEEWKVEVGAMPRLARLELKSCRKLRLVPEEGLERLVSLRELHLDCMDSLSMDRVDELEKNRCKVIRK